MDIVDEILGASGHKREDPRTVDADLAKRLAWVRRLRPIEIPSSVSQATRQNGWHRVDIDEWGRPLGGGVQWVGGSGTCLRSCLGYVLGATNIAAIPDLDDLAEVDWLEPLNKRLAERTGTRLDEITAEAGLASRGLWIAVLDEGDGSHHAVVAREVYVMFDPAGSLQGYVPRDRVRYGLELASTRRVVPRFSIQPRGYVAA